jgi:hypothetical protein
MSFSNEPGKWPVSIDVDPELFCLDFHNLAVDLGHDQFVFVIAKVSQGGCYRFWPPMGDSPEQRKNSSSSIAATSPLCAIQGPRWSAREPCRPNAYPATSAPCLTIRVNSGAASVRERKSELRSAPKTSRSSGVKWLFN